jgi:selenocysteine-specific elongation factor
LSSSFLQQESVWRPGAAAAGLCPCPPLPCPGAATVARLSAVQPCPKLKAEGSAPKTHMKHIIVGTAGHIDHGKTALVKALTGIDADRLKEEKQRGITIDIGFADLTLADLRLGFVDVPGHERFVKNMLAGAHGLDLVMLVVAADESIMPQTREHFDICRLLGIKSGLVALTKSDMVDPELLELARAEVEDFVRGSFLEGAPILPVSSRTGAGIEELKATLAQLASAIEPKALGEIARLPVDRAFSIKGFGTVITGTLIAGEFAVGDEIEILPTGIRTKIRNLQVHGSDTTRALAGQRTAINLQGVNTDQVGRGMVLAPAGRLPSTSMIDARLDLLASAPRPLVHRARVRFHHGTAEVLARVVVLAGNKGDDLPCGEGSAAQASTRGARIEPGETQFVQFRLEQPITALPGDRFIIRSYSPQVTIGGGVILDARPEKHRTSNLAARTNLEHLQDADRHRQIELFIKMAGVHGVSSGELTSRTGATDPQIIQAVRSPQTAGRVLEASANPHVFIANEAYKELASKVELLVASHHKQQPLSLGLGREELREKIFGTIRPEIFRFVISRLSETGKIASERDTVKLASHRPALTGADSEQKDRLEAAVKKAGLQGLTLEEAAVSAAIPLELCRKLNTLLTAEGKLVRIGDFVFHSESVERLKNLVRARKAVGPKIDVAVFKELTGGLTRKYAIPLLEYLDRERITRRLGNEREIL